MLTVVIASGAACSSGGDASPKSGARSAPTIPDPRTGTLAEAPAPELPARSPEFPPEGTSLDQLRREGKVEVLK